MYAGGNPVVPISPREADSPARTNPSGVVTERASDPKTEGVTEADFPESDTPLTSRPALIAEDKPIHETQPLYLFSGASTKPCRNTW
jgi:hypothetical protein